MKHYIQRIRLLFRWALGVIFLLAGLGIIAAGDIVPSLFIITLSFLITPLADKYLFSKLKWPVPAWAKVILGITLLVGFGMTTSPTLAIETPRAVTNQSPVAVGVKYISGKTVKLYLNDKELGEKQISESSRAVFEDIQLSEGNNNFKAVVVDDKKKSTSRKVIYDITPPNKPNVLDLSKEVNNKNLIVHGTAERYSTIKIYFNANEARTLKANNNGGFSTKFVLSKPKNSFTFETIDLAGNSSGLTDKIEIAYIDTKKLADEEKKAKQGAEKAQREQEAAEKKRSEEVAKKARDNQVKQQQQKDLTSVYESSKNLFDLSDKGNELVAASLMEYSALKISRATLYSRVKDAEVAQNKIWQGLVDLGNKTPESLKDYEKDITGFDGGIVYLQVAVKLRKEAMGELAKYIDTSSLQNMRNYETKLNEQTPYAVNGFIKLRGVGDKLGVELDK